MHAPCPLCARAQQHARSRYLTYANSPRGLMLPYPNYTQ